MASAKRGARRTFMGRRHETRPTPDLAMENPAYVVLSQQMALQSQMSMIANNLANMNTPAYRDQKLVFQEMLGNKAANPGLRGEGARVSFVGMAGTLADTREGPLEAT